jgi:hypothetical protein
MSYSSRPEEEIPKFVNMHNFHPEHRGRGPPVKVATFKVPEAAPLPKPKYHVMDAGRPVPKTPTTMGWTRPSGTAMTRHLANMAYIG